MVILSKILVALVAIEHIYILFLEMFQWTEKRTRKIFGISAEDAERSKLLAANQGLYNGFLAAGMFWGLLHPNAPFGAQIQLFFVACVVVAAIYGAATVVPRIGLVQGGPALLALLSILIWQL